MREITIIQPPVKWVNKIEQKKIATMGEIYYPIRFFYCTAILKRLFMEKRILYFPLSVDTFRGIAQRVNRVPAIEQKSIPKQNVLPELYSKENYIKIAHDFCIQVVNRKHALWWQPEIQLQNELLYYHPYRLFTYRDREGYYLFDMLNGNRVKVNSKFLQHLIIMS